LVVTEQGHNSGGA